MASRKKTRPLKGNGNDAADYAEFIRDLIKGDIVATALVETVNGRGQLTKLEYDDPNG